MVKKRAADAFSQGARLAAMATPKAKPAPAAAPDKPMSGNWSRIAFESLKTDLAESKEELQKLMQVHRQGILEGVLPIRIPSDRITDLIGSDRLTNEEEHDSTVSFDDLVENIRKRGQKTPIWVRPVDPSWKPSEEDPFDPGTAEFSLQSGRRRLAACRALGIAPLAFIAFPEDENGRLADLQERFFENVARRELTAVEKLFSIGMLATEMPDLLQEDIANILHTNRSDVSRGIKLFANFEKIAPKIDIKTASYREIEKALKEVDKPGAASSEAEAAPAPSTPFEELQLKKAKLTLKENTRGVRRLTISSKALDDETIERIKAILEED